MKKVYSILSLVGPGRQGLDAFRRGSSGTRRYCDSAGVLGSLGGELRLRHLGDPRLAHHHLPALLRERCVFSGFAMVQTLLLIMRKVMQT
jgi:hypothetical protein